MTEIQKTAGALSKKEVIKTISDFFENMQRSDGFTFDKICLLDKERNKFVLSVQGSNFAYCEPRTALEKLTDYEAVEVAFMNEKGDFIHPKALKMGNMRSFCRVSTEHHDDGDVFAYVPMKDLMLDFTDFILWGGQLDFGEHGKQLTA